MTLKIIDRSPDYGIAHPDEDATDDSGCYNCALAVRPDTGEIVLLWRCGGINWSISRETPDHDRHRNDLEAGRISVPNV